MVTLTARNGHQVSIATPNAVTYVIDVELDVPLLCVPERYVPIADVGRRGGLFERTGHLNVN